MSPLEWVLEIQVGKEEVSILSLCSWLQDKFRKQGNT